MKYLLVSRDSKFSGYNIVVIKKEINHKNVTVNWNNVIQYESEAGNGLSGCDYKQILSAIGNSI